MAYGNFEIEAEMKIQKTQKNIGNSTRESMTISYKNYGEIHDVRKHVHAYTERKLKKNTIK